MVERNVCSNLKNQSSLIRAKLTNAHLFKSELILYSLYKLSRLCKLLFDRVNRALLIRLLEVLDTQFPIVAFSNHISYCEIEGKSR